MSRTYRKKSYGSRAIDRECSSHGSCEYCRKNRLYQRIKEQQKVQDMYTYYKQELSKKGSK